MIEHWFCFTEGKYKGYSVSDRGRVTNPHGSLLKQYDHSEKYKRVIVNSHWVYVHQMVLQAFFPTDNENLVADHIDNDPTNNNVDNLRWVTRKQNTQRAGREGKLDTSNRRNIPIELTDRHGAKYVFTSQAEASRTLGIPDCSINKALRGHRKTVHGYEARYV